MAFQSPEVISKLTEPDPELVELLSETPMPKMDYNDQAGFLARVDAMQAAAVTRQPFCPASEVTERDLEYTNREGDRLRVRVYRRTLQGSRQHRGPLIVHYHGGGGCVGTPKDEARPARDFVRSFGAVCVSPEFRLAPKHPFPPGINDCWDALKWAAANAESLGADPKLGFIITGVSYGAGVAAVLTHQARDEGLSPLLTGQHISCGPYMLPEKVPEKYRKWHNSYVENKDPILTRESHKVFERAYDADLDSPLHIVSNHPDGQTGLPRAFIQAAGMDLTRDNAVVYDMMLRDSGVETRLEIYPEVPHAWFAFADGLTKSRQYRMDLLEGFGWLLGMKPEAEPL